MRISDWSSDVCSSDLRQRLQHPAHAVAISRKAAEHLGGARAVDDAVGKLGGDRACAYRGIIGDDLEGQRRDAVAVFGKLELLEHRIGRAAMRGRGAESEDRKSTRLNSSH